MQVRVDRRQGLDMVSRKNRIQDLRAHMRKAEDELLGGQSGCSAAVAPRPMMSR